MTSNGEDDDDVGQPQLPSPIHRILVIHLNLHERCMSGETLGEGASLEELSEQILYYHCDRRINSNGMDGGRDHHNPEILMQEAVQFLGLCTALYTLPSSLTISEINEGTFSESRNGDKTLQENFSK